VAAGHGHVESRSHGGRNLRGSALDSNLARLGHHAFTESIRQQACLA
jgi:hypothetical protein